MPPQHTQTTFAPNQSVPQVNNSVMSMTVPVHTEAFAAPPQRVSLPDDISVTSSASTKGPPARPSLLSVGMKREAEQLLFSTTAPPDMASYNMGAVTRGAEQRMGMAAQSTDVGLYELRGPPSTRGRPENLQTSFTDVPGSVDTPFRRAPGDIEGENEAFMNYAGDDDDVGSKASVDSKEHLNR